MFILRYGLSSDLENFSKFQLAIYFLIPLICGVWRLACVRVCFRYHGFM